MLINNAVELNKLIIEKSCLVFDFDGVIADSVNIKGDAFSELYKIYGNDIAKKVVQHHLKHGGMSRYDKFRYYHNNFLKEDVSESEIQDLSDKFSNLVVKKVIDANEIFGAEEFLNLHCLDNMLCTINSATPHDEIDFIVHKRGIKKYFAGIYGSPNSKTFNLQYILKFNKLSPSDALFFGDAHSDYQAAVDVGVTFVGVGKEIMPVLEKSDKVTYYIDDFISLLNIIEQQG